VQVFRPKTGWQGSGVRPFNLDSLDRRMELYDASIGFHGRTTSNFVLSPTSRPLSSEGRGRISLKLSPRRLIPKSYGVIVSGSFGVANFVARDYSDPISRFADINSNRPTNWP